MSESRLAHEDPYFVVRLHPNLRLVSCVRTAARFPDLEAGRRAFGALVAMDFGDADRLLADLRDAPGNNSPEWEALFDQLGRPFFFHRFPRRAVLVRSIAGKLQVERMAREGGRPEGFGAFLDEAEARRFLLR